MQRIVVANPKGGCGKSTLTASLAAFFAANGRRVAVLDCDPQRSIIRWGARRAADLAPVTTVPQTHPGLGLKSGWLLRVPAGTECLIADTPAAIQGHELAPLLRTADVLLIPVMPSSMDLGATQAFVDLLARLREVREGALRVGLVGMRVRGRSRAAREFDAAVSAMGYPCVARIRDSMHYVNLIGEGRALDDDHGLLETDLRGDWLPLLRWLLQPLARRAASAADPLAGAGLTPLPA
jgi:chromosome partitioning protein